MSCSDSGRRAPRPRALARHLVGALIAVALVFALRTMVMDVFTVPSASMEPTLMPGDWVAVERLRYGPRLPLTKARLFAVRRPQLGDVVVFRSSHVLIADAEARLIAKRLVGLPGDTLWMRSGRLFRNGRFEGLTYDTAGIRQAPLWHLSRFSLVAPSLPPVTAIPTSQAWGPILVPKDSVFVLGDNRRSSTDSRHFGPVPEAAVEGVVRAIYFHWAAGPSPHTAGLVQRLGLVADPAPHRR